MVTPAKRLVEIEPNKSYNKESKLQIYALHCLKTNIGEVRITDISNNVTKFPSGAFIGGAIYPIPTLKIEYKFGDADFIGYATEIK